MGNNATSRTTYYDRALRFIRKCAEAGQPAPTNLQIGGLVGNPGSGGKIVKGMVSLGLFRIERKNAVVRRFVFPDGVATGWTVPGHQNQKKSKVTRPCITCGRLFLSEGIGNRMCDECRRESWAGEAYRIAI